MFFFPHKVTGPRNAPLRGLCGDGFTLLEMSIVLVIIAVILAGGAVTFTASLKQRQHDETVFKIKAIQKALLDYRRTFNRLPCPASFAFNAGDQYFGVAAPDGNVCTGSTPAAFLSYTISAPRVAVNGMVPIQTLHLPDEYAFDGWGRRFQYVVDTQFTATDAFLTGATTASISTDITNNIQRLIVCGDSSVACTCGGAANTCAAPSANVKTASAAYLLISHGANGHGAWPRYKNTGGVMFGIPSFYSSGSSNTMEKKNCHCDSTAVVDFAFDNVFYQAPYSEDESNPLNTFDDIVVYATRADLRSVSE